MPCKIHMNVEIKGFFTPLLFLHSFFDLVSLPIVKHESLKDNKKLFRFNEQDQHHSLSANYLCKLTDYIFYAWTKITPEDFCSKRKKQTKYKNAFTNTLKK